LIGIDLIKIPRVQRSLERFGDKFLLRYLSKEEILLIKSPKTAAGFWAAKEACSKALGCGISKECGFHDIHITKTSKGAPCIALSKRVSQYYNVADLSVSITHDGDYAMAVVAIEKTKV